MNMCFYCIIIEVSGNLVIVVVLVCNDYLLFVLVSVLVVDCDNFEQEFCCFNFVYMQYYVVVDVLVNGQGVCVEVIMCEYVNVILCYVDYFDLVWQGVIVFYGDVVVDQRFSISCGLCECEQQGVK